jgi:hypothetical protein
MAFPNSRGCELERQVDGLEAELAKTEERHAIQIESLEGKVTELNERLLKLETFANEMAYGGSDD